jgi:D-alanyl-D-alanine carboxypeptidase
MMRRGLSICALTTILFVLAVTGCSQTQPISTVNAGSDPAYAAKLRKLLLRQLQNDRAPGALVYVSHPSLGTWSAALGSSDLNGAPLNISSHMRIGSITKTLTATAVLRLADRGLIELDKPIAFYLPGVVQNRGQGVITVRQLLNMTAGLFNNTEDEGLNLALDANPYQVFTPQHSLNIAFGNKGNPYFDAGKGWHYSNTNYIVLGLLLERVTGVPAPALFEQLIFAPLGMRQSVMPEVASAAIPSPYSCGYLYGTNVDSLNAYLALIGGKEGAATAVHVPPGAPPQDATHWNPAYTWTSGSAISTLSDMAIWARALGAGALLSPAMHQQQVAPTHFGNQGVVSYGLGIAEVLPACESRNEVLPRFIGHNGAIPGYQSLVGYSPDTGGVIVVLANSEIAPNTPLLEALPADNLARIIQQFVFLQRVQNGSSDFGKRCVTAF